MERATNIGPILQINYRCDQVIKDNQDGDILWMGPSEKQVLAVEMEPRDFLIDPLLVDTMKQQILNYLRTQPFVQALLQEGDTLGMAQCEILYKDNTTGFWAAMNQDNLSIVNLNVFQKYYLHLQLLILYIHCYLIFLL